MSQWFLTNIQSVVHLLQRIHYRHNDKDVAYYMDMVDYTFFDVKRQDFIVRAIDELNNTVDLCQLYVERSSIKAMAVVIRAIVEGFGGRVYAEKDLLKIINPIEYDAMIKSDIQQNP